MRASDCASSSQLLFHGDWLTHYVDLTLTRPFVSTAEMLERKVDTRSTGDTGDLLVCSLIPILHTEYRNYSLH
jgi:hypothetical protein